MTEVNIPLLRKAVEWAEVEAAKPRIDSAWAQDAWLTRPFDVAELVLEGTPFDEWDLPATAYRRVRDVVATQCGTAYCIAGYVAQTLDARYAERSEVGGVHASDFARAALGLTADQAQGRGGLFDGGNTIEDVRRIAEEIAGERL